MQYRDDGRIFNMYCMNMKSCQFFKINQLTYSDTNTEPETLMNTELSIYCMGYATCDGAEVSYRYNILLNLYMFGPRSWNNKGLIIKVKEYDSINIECGNDNNKYYFMYDKNKVNLPNKAVYDFSFPCQDIIIYSDDKKCEMEYKLTDYYDFVEIIESDIEAHWIDTNLLYTPICIENDNKYDHNIKMEYNVTLNFDYKTCKQYFDPYAVDRNIEGIFSAVLLQFIHKNNNIITDIKGISVSGDYDCDNLMGYHQLMVTFDVKSTEESNDKIEFLLNINSDFYARSILLFDKYFQS